MRRKRKLRLCGIDIAKRKRSVASNEEAMMNKNLSDAVITAVRKLVHEAEVNNEILDAYGTAERIKRTFPDEILSTGELVAVMLDSSLRAMELSPRGLVLEIILPPESPPEGEAIDDVVPMKNGNAP
jgi:hypothetical protein